MIKGLLVGASLVAAMSIEGAESYYRCQTYNRSSIRLDPPVAYERIYLAVPKRIDDRHAMILFLTDAAGRRVALQQYLYCHPDGKGGAYRCGGECDAGEILITKNGDLHFGTEAPLELDIEKPDPMEEEDRSTIHPVGKDRISEAHPSPCPPVVVIFFNPVRDGEDASIRHPYVCYDRKSGGEYQGCDFSTRPCERIGKRHFGRYPTESASHAALERCVQSRPRNPK